MKNRRFWRFLGFSIVAAAALFLLIALITSPFLVLTNASTGETLLTHSANEGLIFSVEFIHSVNQSPVAEIFEIRDNEIVLSAMEFEDFGAGMPTQLEKGQTLTHLPQGIMRIDGFDRTMYELRYMVGQTVVLYIEQRRVPLYELAERGTLIEFTVERRAGGIFNGR
jgi:hypothetical protein